MDSFISLFDPNACDGCNNKTQGISNINENCLPPEPQAGNIEYKLKIINPSKQRFEHLVTQVCVVSNNIYVMCNYLYSFDIIKNQLVA